MFVTSKVNFFFLIFAGSPADKANLEVGDEIMEVNGRSLAQSSHAEVIAYIHKVH